MHKIGKAVVLWFAFCLMASLHASEDDAESRKVFNQQVWQKVQAGDFQGALSQLDQGIKADEERFGKDHPILLRHLDAKSRLLFHNFSDTEAAQQLTERIQEILRTAYQSGDTEKLYLAGIYSEQNGESELAANFFSQLVERAESTADENPQLLIDALSHQALAFSTLPLTKDKAVAAYERVLALRSTHQGEMHFDSIQDRMMLAILRERQGQRAEAERLLERNVEIAEKHYWELHKNVRDNRYTLALFYEETGQYDASINQLDLIINRFNRDNPLNKIRNPDMILPLMLKARVQIRAKKYEGAVFSLSSASAIFILNESLSQEQTGPRLRTWLAEAGIIGNQGLDIALADRWELANEQYNHHLEEIEFEAEFFEGLEDLVELEDSQPYLAYLLMVDVLDRALEAARGSTENSDVVRAYEKLLEMRERHWPGDSAEWLALTSYTKARNSNR